MSTYMQVTDTLKKMNVTPGTETTDTGRSLHRISYPSGNTLQQQQHNQAIYAIATPQ